MLTPWSEAVGTVEEAGEDYVVLSFRCIIPTRQGEPARWMLRKDSKVAILLLDNGSIRVRNLDLGSKHASKP